MCRALAGDHVETHTAGPCRSQLPLAWGSVGVVVPWWADVRSGAAPTALVDEQLLDQQCGFAGGEVQEYVGRNPSGRSRQRPVRQRSISPHLPHGSPRCGARQPGDPIGRVAPEPTRMFVHICVSGTAVGLRCPHDTGQQVGGGTGRQRSGAD